MNGELIEPVYNTGKLILLSKTISHFPHPIVIFSMVRKYLERMWLEKHGAHLWEHHQDGFRESHGIQELISKLCNSIHQNKKGAIVVFIDVKKAFDSVDRSQVMECVINAGIDNIGIKTLAGFLNNSILNHTWPSMWIL